MKTSTSWSDYKSEDMQRIVERFVKIKWITGLNMVTPDDLLLRLTPAARASISPAADAFRKCAPQVCNAGSKPPLLVRAWHRCRFEILYLQLGVKLGVQQKRIAPDGFTLLTSGEKKALQQIVVGYAMRLKSFFPKD